MAQFVGGRYQLIAQLGGGGMADVYLAKLSGKADFAKLAVVKRLKPVEDDDPEIIRMFADEARLCARLNHPNIVQTFEVGEDGTGPFLVMEYIEGQSLQRIRSRMARRNEQVPRAMSLRILGDTLAALAYSHTLTDHDGTPLHVVHRDISPENIMVTYAGATKLVDFGVAKTSASINRTRAGVLKGKVAYMAPEQARSDTTIDERADVFAAGLVLWELLTYQRIWEGRSEAQVFERLLDKDPLPAPRTVDPQIPEDLDAICVQALQKEKEARFSSASALHNALEQAVARNDLRSSQREIGEFVSALFEPERAKVRALVVGAVRHHHEAPEPLPPNPNRSLDAALADPSLQRAEPPNPAVPSIPPPAVPPKLQSSPAIVVDGQDPPAETPFAIIETKPAFRPRPPPSSARAWMLAGLVVGLSIVGGALVAGPRILGRVAPPPRPAPLVAPAPPIPVEVVIDVAVRPATARILVDGQPTASNPYHLRVVRSDRPREIRAEAEGFESHTTVLAFDRDRAIELSLVPSPLPPASATASVALSSPPPVRRGKGTARAPTAPAPAATPKGAISEVDLAKPKPGKHDKIDTDVFGN